jgi:hypothetical protein
VIREMTLADAIYVIRRMRASDRAAMRALNPHSTDEQYAIDRFGTDFHYTLCNSKGEPVVIGGARVSAAKCAFLWIIATDELPSVRKSLVRFSQRFLNELNAQKLAHRFEGMALESEPVCAKFMKFFGFDFEGTRRKAGANGENIVVFAKVV